MHVTGWPPSESIIGQQRQTGDGLAVAIEQAAVINEHPFGKAGLLLTLDFEVQVEPLLAAATPRHARELVDHALADVYIAYHGAQLLLEKHCRLRPVDLRMGLGEIEAHEVIEEELDRLLPWAVVIVRHCPLRGSDPALRQSRWRASPTSSTGAGSWWRNAH